MDARLGGGLDGGAHRLPVRVYWEDTDAGGIVYHASYIRFMERGRTEFLRALGLDQSRLAAAATPFLFVVRRMVLDYLRPARLDDLLEVETRPAALAGARMELDQSVRRGADVLVTARVTVATIGADGRPCRLPPAVRIALAGAPPSDAPA